MVLAVEQGAAANLIEALVALVEPQLWRRYCRLAAALSGGGVAVAPVFAIGSLEWRRQQEERCASDDGAIGAEEEAAGRARLLQRGKPPVFAGAPAPLGAAGGAAFDEFIARHRGPSALLAEITGVENELVAAFEEAGRYARFHATGFCDAARTEVEPGWFGRMRLDFANNRVILPDGSVVAGVEVTLTQAAVAGCRAPERPAHAMLREALVALWERGAFTAGTGNERVLALVLQELRLSAADPPYGFKSAETIRKLRKALKMSM
jgi:hypothetical protein